MNNNNNYHTQMDKNNLLNEVAANNNLLQQQMQMQNFTGTPINKNQQFNPQFNQPMMQQPMTQPRMQQPLIQQPQVQQTQVPQPQIHQPQNQSNGLIDDELELSEPKIDLNQTPQQKQINRQIQEVVQNQYQKPVLKQGLPPNDPRNYANQMMQQGRIGNPTSAQYNHPGNIPMNPPTDNQIGKGQQETNAQRQNQNNNQNGHLLGLPPLGYPMMQGPVNKNQIANKASGELMTNYIVIPVLLVIFFIILVHPKTSKFLQKYVPPMKDMKGFLIRGMILAIAYIVVKLVADSTKKK